MALRIRVREGSAVAERAVRIGLRQRESCRAREKGVPRGTKNTYKGPEEKENQTAGET